MKVKDPLPPEDKNGVVCKIGCLCGELYNNNVCMRQEEVHIPESRNRKQPADWPDLIDEHAQKDGYIIEWNQVMIYT